MPHSDTDALLWLASQEGLRLRPYKDPDGKQWNVGFGHLLSYKNKPPTVRPLTAVEAWRLLRHDWNKAKHYAGRALDKVGVRPKNPGTQMALALLAYNAGPGIFNTRKFRGAASKGEQNILQWMKGVNTVNGRPDPTLTRRRDREFAWAVSPEKYPLPISPEARQRFAPLADPGPTKVSTPIPDHDVPGEAPAHFDPEADIAAQGGSDGGLLSQGWEQATAGWKKLGEVFSSPDEETEIMAEKVKPEGSWAEDKVRPEGSWGETPTWTRKFKIPGAIPRAIKGLWDWMTDNNRSEAEALARKHGLNLEALSPTPTPGGEEPQPTQPETTNDNLIEEYSPQAGETRQQGGGEPLVLTEYNPSLSSATGGEQAAGDGRSEEDKAYARWLQEQAKSRMQSLDRDAAQAGERSEGLRRKLLQRQDREYEKPYSHR